MNIRIMLVVNKFFTLVLGSKADFNSVAVLQVRRESRLVTPM